MECLELLGDSGRAAALRAVLDEHDLTTVLPLPLLGSRSLALRVAPSGFLSVPERLALLSATAAGNLSLAKGAGFSVLSPADASGVASGPVMLLPATLSSKAALIPRPVQCHSWPTKGAWAPLFERVRSSLESRAPVTITTGSTRRPVTATVGGVIIGFSATCEQHASPSFGTTVLVTAEPDADRIAALSKSVKARAVDAGLHPSPVMQLMETRSSNLQDALSWADLQVRSCADDSMLLSVTSNTASTCYIPILLLGAGGAVRTHVKSVSKALLDGCMSPQERTKLKAVEDWLQGLAGLSFVDARDKHARAAEAEIAESLTSDAAAAGSATKAAASGSGESARGAAAAGDEGSGRAGRKGRRKGRGKGRGTAGADKSLDELARLTRGRGRLPTKGPPKSAAVTWSKGRRGRGVVDDDSLLRMAGDARPADKGAGKAGREASEGTTGPVRMQTGLRRVFSSIITRLTGRLGPAEDPSVASGLHVARLACEFPVSASKSSGELLTIVTTFAEAVCWFVSRCCSPMDLRSIDLVSTPGSPGSLNAIILRKTLEGFEDPATVSELLPVKPVLRAAAFVYRQAEAKLSPEAMEAVDRAGSRLVNVGHTCLDAGRMATVVFSW